MVGRPSPAPGHEPAEPMVDSDPAPHAVGPTRDPVAASLRSRSESLEEAALDAALQEGVSADGEPGAVGRSVPPPQPVESQIREALERDDVRTALTVAAVHYRAPLFRFCLAFLHDESTAEDVVQTTLAVASERAHQFSHQSTFRTWLFGIARHKALDAAAAREGLPLSAVTDSRWIADAIGPVTGLRNAEDLRTLTEVLDALGAETRALLTLRFREELSYKEIAGAFEISEQAARKRMFDALEKIRKMLFDRRGDFFERA